MANWWDDPAFNGKPPTQEDVAQQQALDAGAVAPQDSWGHFMDYVINSLGRGLATAAPYLADVASLNSRVPHDPAGPLLGRGRATTAASQLYSKVVGDEVPLNKMEERAGSIAQGVGAAAFPLGEVAGIPRALLAGAGGGLGAQMAHELLPDSEWAPLVGGLIGGFGPHIIERGVRSAATGHMIRQGMAHPDWQAVNDVIVGDLEGGGTLAHPNVSKKGAVGPQQVMPETARKPGFGIRPWDGKTQADLARVGRQYSAAMMSKYNGDVAKVFAAYNAGPGTVDKAIAAATKAGNSRAWAGYGIPPETVQYVMKGLKKLGMSVDHTADYGYSKEGPPKSADILPFPSPELPRVMTEQALGEYLDTGKIPEEYLTPAERQDMDASVDKPVVDNTGYEKHTPYIDEPNTPANDVQSAHDLELEKHLNTPENMAEAQRIHEEAFSDALGEPLPDDYQSAIIKQQGGTGRKFNKTPEEMKAVLEHADSKVREFWNNKLELIKAMLKDDSGSLRGDDNRGERAKGYGTSEDRDTTDEWANLDPEEKLSRALKGAQPVSAEQRRAYKAARAERSGHLDKIQQEQAGLTGYKQQAGALKGELPKATFNSIAHHFTEDDIHELLNRVNRSNSLLPFEKFRAQTALLKLLGSEGAKVPTANEIKLLSGVLHENVIKQLLDNRDFMSKFWHTVGEVINFPRTIMASFDLSAPLRQGAFFIGRPEYWKAFVSMFKQWGSEKAFQAVQASIRDHPNFLLARKAGLSITDASGHFLSDREEAFKSHWAEKIPGVRMSDRAYSGFLNKLRFDVFNKLIEDGKNLGYNWEHDTKALKQLGSYINAGSGRGNLGKFAQAADVLNAGFFSPRYVASRFNLLNLPYYLFKADPLVRNAYLRDLTTYVGAAATVLTLAKMSGAEVNLDWKSSDFLKIKIGNTRRDILSGFGQIVHLVGQLATGQYANANGETIDLGSKFGVKTRLDTLWNFIQSKFSPTVGWAADEMRGKDFAHPKDMVGQEHTVLGEAANHLLPMSPQDIADVLKDQGVTVDKQGIHGTPEQFSKAIEPGIESTLGVGIQTYQPRPPKSKSSKNWWDDDVFGKGGGDLLKNHKQKDWWDDPAFGGKS